MEDSERSKKRNIMATSIASPFASMIAKFVMHPIDTIKSKVQVNRMQLKSVSDYKIGMVTNISTLFFIKLSKPSETRECQVFSEVLPSQYLDRRLLLQPTCPPMNILNIIWLNIQ